MTPPKIQVQLSGACSVTLKLNIVRRIASATIPPASPTALLSATPRPIRAAPIISRVVIGKNALRSQKFVESLQLCKYEQSLCVSHVESMCACDTGNHYNSTKLGSMMKT